MKLTVYLLLLGLVISAALAKPTPQESDTDTGEVSNKTETEEELEEEEVGTKVKDNDDDTEDEEEEEKDEPLKAIGEAFEGFLNLLGGVAKAAERVATDPEVHETVGEIVEAGIQGTIEAVESAAELVKDAPRIIEEQRPLVEGLAITIGETSGFVGGSIEELKQTSKLASIFAKAYTEDTLVRIDNFLKVFNRRLKCNTICKGMEEDKTKKSKCEIKFCVGFVPPKTKKQLEDEKLQFVEEYDYDYDYDDEEEDEVEDDGPAEQEVAAKVDAIE